MALPAHPNQISIGNVCDQFGVPKSNVYLSATLGAGAGYVPLTGIYGSTGGPFWARAASRAIPIRSGLITLDNFHNAPIAGNNTQSYYIPGTYTFTAPRGFSSFKVEWYDNSGYRTVTVPSSGGQQFTVVIGASRATSYIAGTSAQTTVFDRTVVGYWGNIDGVLTWALYVFTASGITTPGTYWGLPQAPMVTYYQAPFEFKEFSYPGGYVTGEVDRLATYGVTLSSSGEGGNWYFLTHYFYVDTIPVAWANPLASSRTTTIVGAYTRHTYATQFDQTNGIIYYQGYDQNNNPGPGGNGIQLTYQQPVWFKITW